METSLANRLKPRQARRIGVFVGLGLLFLVWSIYFLAYRSIQGSFVNATEQTLASETTLLADHLERSFSLVTTTLLTVGEISSINPTAPSHVQSEELRRAIGNSPVIRSLSLVDSSGLVLASSNPRNIGQSIAPEDILLHTEDISWQMGEVSFGRVLPYRDLYEWSKRDSSPTQELMPAIYSVTQDGHQQIWVATVNISFFHNIWQQIDHSPAVEIAVFNFRGEKIMSHHTQPVSDAEIFARISDSMLNQDIGHFYFDAGQEMLVVYRSEMLSPLIVASIANISVLSEQTAQTRKFLLSIALLGSLLVVGVLLALYRLYLRQARASTLSNNLLSGIAAHVMMTRSSLDGKIEDINELMLSAFGFTRQEVIGADHKIFGSGLERPELFSAMWEALKAGEIWRGTFRNKTKSGELLWLNATIIPLSDEWGETSHYVALYSDITQAIRLSREFEREKAARQSLELLNQKLKTQAMLDPLTGVANRRGLDEFVQQINEQTNLSQMSLAVLMIDIDHFKQVNDTYGHSLGDGVLSTLAKTWSDLLRSSDLLARLGGEEFVILLPRTVSADAQRVAEKLRVITQETPIVSDEVGQPIYVTVSIGIAYAEHVADQTIDELLAKADEALYAAKDGGRNRAVTGAE